MVRLPKFGPKLADPQKGDWWYLDGLHRLLAARILGLSVEGEIYR